jgi:glyoxalase superfamily protein
VRYQLVIDCADPDRLARFWAAALSYVPEPPPDGFASWDDYWRDVGVPEEELGIGVDCIIDPEGSGPRIWFQVVPEIKSVKNRLHLDVHVGGRAGGRSRSRSGGSGSTPRPGGCPGWGPPWSPCRTWRASTITRWR